MTNTVTVEILDRHAGRTVVPRVEIVQLEDDNRRVYLQGAGRGPMTRRIELARGDSVIITVE